jgi:hypothetical protein
MAANLPRAGELPDKLRCRVALRLSAEPNPTYIFFFEIRNSKSFPFTLDLKPYTSYPGFFRNSF